MIWLAFLGIAVAGGGIIVLMVKVTLSVLEKGVGEAIGGNLDAAEFITRTGLAPPEWGIPQAEKVRKWQQEEIDEELMRRRKTGLKRHLIRRLRKLIRFIRNTSIMDSERSRERTLSILKGMADEWRGREWENIVGF